MLETDEVDDDYFTPVASTTLSSIFGKATDKPNADNSSLKYTAPKANSSQKSEDLNKTKCVFACALYGYQWSDDVYASKGKLGLAIIHTLNSNIYCLILYDSSKKTLSCATISESFEITIKGKSYISYFDNSKTFWTLYATESEINTFTEKLKQFNICIKHAVYDDSVPPKPDNSTVNESDEQIDVGKVEVESDTDSSVNRKTKASILSRMASMGQAILPSDTTFKDKTSDSSDTNENNNQTKVTRHKPIKSIVKRNQDKIIPIINSEPHEEVIPKVISKIDQVGDNNSIYTIINGQLMPLSNQAIGPLVHSSFNDLNVVLSEQRVNNSELRINMNRINDKVDNLLDIIKEKDRPEDNCFQITIFQKLIAEYEAKIKTYETILNLKKIDPKTVSLKDSKTDNVSEVLKLMKINEDYEITISQLKEDFEKYVTTSLGIIEVKDKIINELKESTNKNEVKCKTDQEIEFTQPSEETKNKVKSIMNDTFHAISNNFESNKEYSGTTVKSIVGTVIKKITLENLN